MSITPPPYPCTGSSDLEKLSAVSNTLPEDDVWLSVCVAVYNVKNYVRECLESLCAQTLEQAEFIVVDDGSADGCGEICDEFARKDRRFKIIHHESNKGSLIARKTAIVAAKGKYITFIDGDDFFSSSKSLEIMYTEIEKSQVDILHFNVECFGYDQGRVNASQSYVSRSLEYHKKIEPLYVLQRIFAHQESAWNIWSNIYLADVLKKVAQDLPDEHIICAEDALLQFLGIYHAQSYMAVRTEPLYSYRVGTGISTTEISFEKFSHYAKEIRVVQIIKEILTRDNCAEPYFEIAAQLLEKYLLNTAVWRMKCVPAVHWKEVFDLLSAEGFHPLLVKLLRKHYQDFSKQGELAKLLYGAKSLECTSNISSKTIAVIYPSYSNGDVQRVISLQLSILLSLGYKVVLITESINKGTEYPLPDNVIRELIPDAIDNGRLQSLDSVLKKHQVDTVLYHQPSSWDLLWDILTIKLKKIRLIAILHENPWQDYALLTNSERAKFTQAQPYFLRLADTLIVPSRAFIPYFASFGCNVQMMPSPYPYHADTATVAPLSMRDGVLWIGNLQDCQNNWTEALSILQRLVRQNPTLQCYMAGSECDPGSVQRLREFITANKLEDNIHWLGKPHNIQQLLSTCRVFLFTSSFEAFPLVLSEAKVCGAPVVCYDLPYVELLQNHDGSEIVAQRDPDAAIQAVNKILLDNDLASQMITASRKSVDDYYKQYDLNVMWQRLLENSCVDLSNKNCYDTKDLRELFEMQLSITNTGLAKLEELVRLKDRTISDKQNELNECTQRLQRILRRKPVRLYKFLKASAHTVKDKLKRIL